MEAIAQLIASTKCPDPIRLLSDYDGNQKTLHHWLSSVEIVLRMYDDVRVAHP